MAITNGYTTLALLKARLGIEDDGEDTELEAVITAASREIDEWTGRRFYAATQTRYFTPTHCERLRVDDLLSVTSLKTDDDGDRTYPTTWATTDYDLGPDNAAADSQPYWWITTAPSGRYGFPQVARGVQIIGSWGYATTAPSTVAEACLHQATLLFRGKDAPLGVQGSPEFGQTIRAVGLHPFVQNMLRPFRTPRLA